MLPKEQRLAKEKDFKRVYRKGSFFSVGLFSVNFAENRMNLARVGVVASKKTAGKAVQRNKIKRQVREAVQKNYPQLAKGYDVIINIKEKALLADFPQIEKEVSASFQRIGRK